MIRLGKHVTQAGDQLYDVSVEKIHKALQNADGEVAVLLQRLQAIRAMDPSQYRKLKTQLPYIVCAQFHPKVRRKENFLFTERFLVDIDHLSEHDVDMDTLRATLIRDPRLELLFVSPSGDGLKLMFRLSEQITDPSYYVTFYKAFCLALNKKYQLGAALDHKTHDVSRCCFVSFDPDAYYNPDSQPVNPKELVSADSFFELEQVKKDVKASEEAIKASMEGQLPEKKPHELPSAVMDKIKEKMGMRVRKPQEKDYIQPEELEEIMAEVQKAAEEVGVRIAGIKPISYGRQVRFEADKVWSEINIFSGKKGVSVVGTTKTGSDKAFCTQMVDYLKAML
ncbi:CRISPR-associated primase-polymerase type B [Pleomorphovibrio marinus]|uniref:CRISPR-associated primase-polymerase type B n=1 Tax=Pleomorphovibrio marinus TaxID=2164132 RepID=UPI000E0BA76F|nr:CRISPR-associated primase-polymerase type B [Pleomorphovibrio marinus]